MEILEGCRLYTFRPSQYDPLLPIYLSIIRYTAYTWSALIKSLPIYSISECDHLWQTETYMSIHVSLCIKLKQS